MRGRVGSLLGQLTAVTLLVLIPTVEADTWDFECERPRDSAYVTTDGQNWTLTGSIPCSREETDGNGAFYVTDYELEECRVVERQEEVGRDLPARMNCMAHDLGESSRSGGPDHVCVGNGTFRMTCEYDWKIGGVTFPGLASSSSYPTPAAQASESPGGGSGLGVLMGIGVVGLILYGFVQWVKKQPSSPSNSSSSNYVISGTVGYGGTAVYPAPDGDRCAGRTARGYQCEHYTGGGRFCWQHSFQRIFR